MVLPKIKFAIVGCGYIGRKHADTVLAHEEAELAALVDVAAADGAGLAGYGAPCFDSLESFLASGTPADVVIIASPNGCHARQAVQCLEARHHIVIEKPMTLTRASAEDVIFKALQVHKHVFVVMQNRYSAPARWLKGLVDSGALGRLYMVQIACYWNRDERYYRKGAWHGTRDLDGGTLFTQFSHFIDMMYWLFGDIRNIRSRFANHSHQGLIDFEDTGMISFDFVNGGIGNLTYTTSVWDRNMDSGMTIIGEHGTVRIGGQYMDQVSYCHIRDCEVPAELDGAAAPGAAQSREGAAANHRHVIANVIDVLKGRSTITTNALEGLKVVDIIERIYAGRPAVPDKTTAYELSGEDQG